MIAAFFTLSLAATTAHDWFRFIVLPLTKDTAEWIEALATVVSALALIYGFRYARAQVEDARRFEKTRRTLDLFKDPAINWSVNRMARFIKTHGSLSAAKEWLDKTSGHETAFWHDFDRVGATLEYIAHLFDLGLLDETLLMKRAAYLIVAAYYLGSPLIRSTTEMTSDYSVVHMARRALKVLRETNPVVADSTTFRDLVI